MHRLCGHSINPPLWTVILFFTSESLLRVLLRLLRVVDARAFRHVWNLPAVTVTHLSLADTATENRTCEINTFNK